MMRIDHSVAYPASRHSVLGRSAVACSQPLAATAAMSMLIAGGNAVDAAVAAAMTLTVVEPTGCGIGSDAFAMVWDGAELSGLNSSGRSPAAWNSDRFSGLDAMPERGWETVTVPGAVAAWISLLRRFGRLSIAQVASPAIRYAREGFIVSPHVAMLWESGAAQLKRFDGFADCFMPLGRAPRVGERFRSEAHARTLESIVMTNGESFYRGELAVAIVADAKRHAAAMTLDDLARHDVEWVKPMSQAYGGGVIYELPPNGQGVATLMAAGILQSFGPGRWSADDPAETHLNIEAMKLAFADLEAHVSDPTTMRMKAAALLDPAYLSQRASLIDLNKAQDPGHGHPPPSGTVCLAVGDEQGMMVSFIQSNYMGFGSGVVVPGTGISLQNRGAGFTLASGHPNEVGGSKRPFHTIIPGFAANADGTPMMAFGLMGGPMQAQGHLQMASRIMAYHQHPQAAADAPRWRILSGRRVAVEPTMHAHLVSSLQALGHEIEVEPLDSTFAFGGAQIVQRIDGGYMAGSDHRKDGLALVR
jgi:gamma-glutamyltranspeptidase / glutathione hydrolase